MKKPLLSIFSLCLLFAPKLEASVAEELQRLNKCYGLFVRERIRTTHPLWVEVSQGKKSGVDACMAIFDKGKLNSDGEISSQGSVYDPEGMRVLDSFLRFHRSQFEIPDYGNVIGLGIDRYTKDVIDANEPSYHFLYSLFGADQKFSDVVTRDYSIKAKRYSVSSGRARSVTNAALPALFQGVYKTIKDENGVTQVVPNEEKGGVSPYSPEFTPTGLLYGFERDTTDNSIDRSRFDANFASFKFKSTNVNQHLGGGLMGTQAYLLGNLGKDGFTSGGTNLFRRWGKHVMKDLLCRDLPALRSKDVVQEVDPESTIAFRTGISCMGCHSAMDPLAGVVRNSRAGFTHNVGMTFNRIKFIGERVPDMPFAEFPTKAADANFHRRPAAGRLYYRSYDGNLIKEEMEGLGELGVIMANTNDLYVCAAKRYYQFLTGINVSLADIGDINTAPFSLGEKHQRDKVINLGLELKNHQSLRSLIKAIIESESFIHPDSGV